MSTTEEQARWITVRLRTRSGSLAAVFVPGSLVWFGANLGSESHADAFRSLWSDRKDDHLCPGGKRSSNQDCGQIGWKPKPGCLCAFRRRLRSRFSTDRSVKPDFLIIDWSDTYQSVCRIFRRIQFSQVRECTAELMKFAERNRYAQFSWLAISPKTVRSLGPKVLKHMVDTVLDSLRAIGIWLIRSYGPPRIGFGPPRNWGNLRDAGGGLGQ